MSLDRVQELNNYLNRIRNYVQLNGDEIVDLTDPNLDNNLRMIYYRAWYLIYAYTGNKYDLTYNLHFKKRLLTYYFPIFNNSNIERILKHTNLVDFDTQEQINVPYYEEEPYLTMLKEPTSYWYGTYVDDILKQNSTSFMSLLINNVFNKATVESVNYDKKFDGNPTKGHRVKHRPKVPDQRPRPQITNIQSPPKSPKPPPILTTKPLTKVPRIKDPNRPKTHKEALHYAENDIPKVQIDKLEQPWFDPDKFYTKTTNNRFKKNERLMTFGRRYTYMFDLMYFYNIHSRNNITKREECIILIGINLNTRHGIALKVPDKTANTLIQAFEFILYYNTIRHLRFDGESGIASEAFQEYLNNKGITFNNCKPGVHTSTAPIDRLCRTFRQYFMDLVVLKYYTDIDLNNFRNFGDIHKISKKVGKIFKSSNAVILPLPTEQEIALIMEYYNNRPHTGIYKLIGRKLSPNQVTLKDEEEIVKECIKNNSKALSENWHHFKVGDRVTVFNQRPYVGRQYSDILGENWIIEAIEGNNFYVRNYDQIKSRIGSNTIEAMWVSRHFIQPHY